MFPVIGEERDLVGESNGGDGHVGVRQGLPLCAPVPAQQTSFPRDRPSHGQVNQAVNERFGRNLFASSDAGMNFCDIDTTAGEHMALDDELVKKLGAAITAVEVIENNRGVE